MAVCSLKNPRGLFASLIECTVHAKPEFISLSFDFSWVLIGIEGCLENGTAGITAGLFLCYSFLTKKVTFAPSCLTKNGKVPVPVTMLDAAGYQ
ncbi:hypothetical protein OOT00_09355 [Desulfobotulus sp. H1]|uniref:Uncharacterized protein n=1 Tax=Desulfobotulus pelophilus TaxID=2823377 RepID=A0ABT3N9Q0_9BACT|nr:hypothetical protein [Desulfobotulus pelophilus]MCW7754192.1 hypothetical protein [Desulfobotulus pelophilus]